MLALGCGCAGASLLVFAVDPNRHAVYPQCLFHATTGLYCAGCGTTRALYALLHGRVLDALQDNALFTLALPVLAVASGFYFSRAWRANAWPRIELKPASVFWNALAVFGVMVVFMVLRNLPGMPFDLLKPLG